MPGLSANPWGATESNENHRIAYDFQHLHDLRLVWALEISERDTRESDHGELGHRLLRILFSCACEPHRLVPIQRRAIEDDSRDHHAFDLPGVLGFLSRRKAQMEPRCGLRSYHSRGVLHFSQVVRICTFDSGRVRGRPDQHVLPSREMQQRLRLQRNSDRFSHGVTCKLRLSLLQRPGAVMNLASNEPATAVERIETVAFRQEMFECAPLRKKHGGNWTIASPQRCWSGTRVVSLARVMDPVIA